MKILIPGFWRRLFGSFCSVAAGWSACVLAYTTIGVVTASHSERSIQQLPLIAGIYAFYTAVLCGGIVLIVWIFLFAWIYLSVPREEKLWKWYLATPLGALAGVVIVFVVGFAVEGKVDVRTVVLAATAAVTGGVTCLFAALTAHWFHKT